MIKREEYIKKVRPFYESDLVKVLVGIRRCGKSVILSQIRDEIQEKTDNIVYLNFEKSSDLAKTPNAEKLLSYVEKNRKEGKCYIFLDEIQEVENWNIAVKDLRLGNNSVFITGSNSRLLSNEILSLLSGRHVAIRIRPFIYQEIVEYCKEIGKECTVENYLIWGGFPGRFIYDSMEAQKAYLSDLVNTIVYKDIIVRKKIRKEALFRKIVNIVLRNNARTISARSIYRYICHEYESVSLNTILKYIGYIKDAYLIDELSKYSTKTKEELAYYQKIYCGDVSFNSLFIDNNRFDLDHNLENIVYNELLFRGYKLKLYRTNDKEIDFYASKDGKDYFVQVAYSIVDSKAYEREFSAFRNLDNLHQKIIITTDTIDYSTSVVRHINLEKFLKYGLD